MMYIQGDYYLFYRKPGNTIHFFYIFLTFETTYIIL